LEYYTHTLARSATHKTKYCTFAEVFFSGGTGCRKNGLGDKTMLGQSRNNNGSVCGGSIERRERERVRPAGKKSESVALGYRTPRIYVRIELMLMPVELQRG